MAKEVKVTIPDNIYAIIEAMGASGETVAKYCLRAIINKAEHDLTERLPEKWQAFTANIEPKGE